MIRRAAMLSIVALALGCYASHGRDGGAVGARDGAIDAPRSCLDRFPSFDRACEVPEDCSLGVHRIDCCGTSRAIGIAERDRARFSELEAACRRELGECMCRAGPTVADDGSTAFSDMPAVACLAGTCVSSFADD